MCTVPIFVALTHSERFSHLEPSPEGISDHYVEHELRSMDSTLPYFFNFSPLEQEHFPLGRQYGARDDSLKLRGTTF